MATSSNHLVDAPPGDRLLQRLGSQILHRDGRFAMRRQSWSERRTEVTNRPAGMLIDPTRERRGLWHNNFLG